MKRQLLSIERDDERGGTTIWLSDDLFRVLFWILLWALLIALKLLEYLHSLGLW